jgi:hypothetical protein
VQPVQPTELAELVQVEGRRAHPLGAVEQVGEARERGRSGR